MMSKVLKMISPMMNRIAGSKGEKILSGTVLLAIAISLVHFLTFSQEEIYLDFLHQLLSKLYFLPVLLAALFLGIKGAIKLALVVSLLYLPHSLNTGLFSKLYIAENLSELILIWTVGIIAGVLIDRLKKVQAEKARLAALEKISTVINVVNNGIMNDYSACEGLTKSLKSIYNNGDGNVLRILEFKDILALPDNKPYEITYGDQKYSYSKNELLNITEFNSGVYAFDYKKLVELIDSISSNNAQNEIYITDLIELFNKKGYTVGAVSPKEQYVVMGFNDKSVLKEMDEIARRNVYEKLKNIIQIDDPDDFFIHDSVVNDLLEMDKKGIPLDIKIDKGAYVGDGVKLNYNVEIGRAAYINGNVVFGKNIKIWRIVHLSTFPHQTLTIEDNVKILWGDIIKGNIIIGENSTIESSVNMTGSDEFPLRIGKNVLIKGTSYLFGSVIEDDVTIEHSVLIKKKVKAEKDKDGKIKPVRFFIPDTEGKELLSDI